jgi:uncharacterized protein
MQNNSKNSKTKTILSSSAILLVILGGAYWWWQNKELAWQNISAGTITFANTSIAVEVANTPELRSIGLGGRTQMDDKSGMLFVFDNVVTPEFWMKDMRFPIDIIFFDRNWKVVDIKNNFLPESYPEIYSPKARVKYAVEVVSGFAKQFEIEEGSAVEFEAY